MKHHDQPYILGYSGLHGSSQYRQERGSQITQLTQQMLFGHDSAVALVDAAKIHICVSEERFNRVKGCGDFPVNAIRYSLDYAGIQLNDVDFIAHGWNFSSAKDIFLGQQDDYLSSQYEQVFSRDVQFKLFEEHFHLKNVQEKLIFVPHHTAHAASTFYPSGFDEALILVADGMGEKGGTTVAVGHGNNIEIIKEFPGLHSFGILYGVFTLYLGFKFNSDEYKVMGLAPYGNPQRFYHQIKSLITIDPAEYISIPFLYLNKTREEKETFSASLDFLAQLLGPRRSRSQPIEQYHRDIAAALQRVFEEAMAALLDHYHIMTRLKNLCMAGGATLNCTNNGMIKRSMRFDHMYVCPAAGDDGTALGAALHVMKSTYKAKTCYRIKAPLLGPSYDNAAITRAVHAVTIPITTQHFGDRASLNQFVVSLLTSGKVIGWFDGAMEFGPRALGSRSILADARRHDMKACVNQKIKKRESFRPFAPAVTAEFAHEAFAIEGEMDELYPAMLCTSRVRPEYEDRLPAVTHIDGSARVQIVERTDNENFWSLLTCFGSVTGLPVLLNTSFNINGQPVVCTPDDALQTLELADLDALVLGQYVVQRKTDQ